MQLTGHIAGMFSSKAFYERACVGGFELAYTGASSVSSQTFNYATGDVFDFLFLLGSTCTCHHTKFGYCDLIQHADFIKYGSVSGSRLGIFDLIVNKVKIGRLSTYRGDDRFGKEDLVMRTSWQATTRKPEGELTLVEVAHVVEAQTYLMGFIEIVNCASIWF